MPLDGAALARACGARGEAAVANQLCRREIGRFQDAVRSGQPLLVACTQESPLFEEQRSELGGGDVAYVNIRETAGWSDEAAAALPKQAALILESLAPRPSLATVSMKSEGVALVYGRDERAIAAARQLAGRLDITVLLVDPRDVPAPALMDLPVVRGRIARAKGHLGAFELTVNDYAQPLPSSRRALAFGPARDGATSRCDIVIDLSGGTPLFPAHEKREGYLRADPGNPASVQKALFDAVDLIGEFEKPVYVELHPEICAHSRSKKIGCTRCLDNCPTGAIAPAGDHVAIDPFVCAGCGTCAAVCPTGAAEYLLPAAAAQADRLRRLLLGYLEAGGEAPLLLVHDAEHGAPLIDALARHGAGLPAHVLPFAVQSLDGLGLDFFATAFAFGAADVRLLTPPARDGGGALTDQFALVEAILSGIGMGHGRAGGWDASDPDVLAQALVALDKRPGAPAAGHLPMGDKRAIARQSLRHLNRVAAMPVEMLDLPQGAPFGGLKVDVAGCTLCLSCVAACPTGALRDDPDRPRLTFTEDACVQCGLCRATCPEKVIALEPRLNFRESAMSAILVKEEEPFHCIRCAKPFGTKSSIESIIAKLEGRHWMYADGKLVERLRMCADCRIIVQSEQAIDPYAGAPRPEVRTTDDYIADMAKIRPRPDDADQG
ncbi:MAG: 4Fe-4S binding protein [Alphaproteobacteria bacterium]|nr:4Fe-4S binding protein [Alphaproteobacteria bacterium]